MKARVPPVPAKTMSRGSSPTSSVRTTRGGVAPTSTTLTLSERWFTTQTSLFDRAATATGSRPTGTDACGVSAPVPGSTEKISSWSSGVFTAKRRVPSGLIASGRTWPLSKVVNDATPSATHTATVTVASSKTRDARIGPPRVTAGAPPDQVRADATLSGVGAST